jgi:asparagine synthase (glutamine-hydrolysing)
MNISEYFIFRHTISKIQRGNITSVDFSLPHDEQPNIPEIKKRLLASVQNMKNHSCFVSGGVDSSLLAAMSKTKEIYTATFPGYIHDESEYAEIVANHIGAKFIPVPIYKEEYMASLEYLIRNKGDGLHPNEPCLFIVAKKARQDGKMIMLSGEGADDIFGGYTDLLENGDKYLTDKESFLNRYAYVRPSKFDLPEEFPFEDFKSWGMEQFILRIHTPGLKARAKNACYAADMGIRFPYLESNLPQMMWCCKKEFKNNKNTLKKIAEEFLPTEIVYRKKVGFPVPLDDWFHTDKGIEKFLLLNVNIWKSLS